MKKLAVWLVVAAGALGGCDNNTRLMENVLDENRQGIEAELTQGADINARNSFGWTALMHAARLGNDELVKVLLDHGAQVDAADNSGWTPLIRAASKGHPQVVETLLEAGAEIDAQENDTGRTALHWAAAQAHPKVVRILLDRGADVTIESKEGWTAQVLAIQSGESEIITMLEKAAR